MQERIRSRAETLRRRLEGELFGLADRVGATVEAGAEIALRVAGRVGRLVEEAGADVEDVVRDLGELERAARARGDTVRDVVRAAPRFTRLVAELGLVVAAYRIHRATRGPARELFGPGASDAARERLDRECARRLHDLCVDLRGGVLKLGQLAASRVDLLPAAYLRELGRLQDRVPPVAAGEIEAAIARDLGADPHALFARFEAEPLAAASLAQVHGAILADGTRVAVKVLVPGIEDVVETDLAALRVIAPALRELWPALDARTLARELSRALAREIDLEAEAAHAERFAAEAAGDAGVRVPAIHRALSSRRVLTLERVEGRRLLEWLEGCEARGEAGARDRDRVLGILAQSFTAQILLRGFFHADPHPGNFLVVEGEDGPEVAILDFGCVQEWPAPRRRAYAELVLATLARDAARVADRLHTLGFHARDDDRAELDAFAGRLLEALGPGLVPATPAEAGERLQRLVAVLQGSPVVQVPDDCILVGRVLASLGGLFVRFRPRVDLLAILAPALLAAARTDGG